MLTEPQAIFRLPPSSPAQVLDHGRRLMHRPGAGPGCSEVWQDMPVLSRGRFCKMLRGQASRMSQVHLQRLPEACFHIEASSSPARYWFL